MKSTKKKLDKCEYAKRRIQGARVAAGYTQAELATVFGVSPSAISKWENNIYAVDLGTAEKLCCFLGVDLPYLIEK
ncbi:DNA-binding transcriptional regulator, XRE-family HTH domain [Ruminococcaceae bacterium FB2012]|nr:DNA-binding transcriptional regulator, XRE-family HTH domain [Ruminococcaceae bacterium FB2012]